MTTAGIELVGLFPDTGLPTRHPSHAILMKRRSSSPDTAMIIAFLHVSRIITILLPLKKLRLKTPRLSAPELMAQSSQMA